MTMSKTKSDGRIRTPSQLIDARIKELSAWRGEMRCATGFAGARPRIIVTAARQGVSVLRPSTTFPFSSSLKEVVTRKWKDVGVKAIFLFTFRCIHIVGDIEDLRQARAKVDEENRQA